MPHTLSVSPVAGPLLVANRCGRSLASIMSLGCCLDVACGCSLSGSLKVRRCRLPSPSRADGNAGNFQRRGRRAESTAAGPPGVRQKPGSTCATLSMLIYYRTSRSLHFRVPFGAVCSLSGVQPEIWSVSWKPPVHMIAFRPFVASLQSTSLVVSPAEGEGAPGSSGPVHSAVVTVVAAQEHHGGGTWPSLQPDLQLSSKLDGPGPIESSLKFHRADPS